MSLYVEPVCLPAQEECEVVVFSIKAAQVYAKERSQPDGETSRPSTPVSILLVKNDTIVLHAVCTAVGEHALFRFTVPADLLEPSVITAYLAVCNEQGSIVRVVDSGKLLILAANEAAEVQRLFKQTTKQVQQLVCSSACSPAAPQQSSNAEAKSHAGLQGALSGLFTRFGARKHNPGHGSGSSSSSGNMPQPSPSTARRVQPPDAATLYSYEHFFVPMLRQWSVVFAHSDGEVLTHSSAIVPEVLPSGAAAQSQIMQLLNLLVEHELWACALLLLGKYPALADHVQRAGLRQDDDDGASLMLLDEMRRGAQPAVPALLQKRQQPQQPLASFQQQVLLQPQQPQSLLGYQPQHQQQSGLTLLQQQRLMLQMQGNPALLHQQQMALLQQHMSLLQQMRQQQQQLGLVPPNMLGSMANAPPMANISQPLPSHRRGPSPSGSDETVESASEILMRLGLLQQARGEVEQLEQEAMEQEALADYMQEDEGAGQQQPVDFLWASSAWSVPLQFGQPGPQRATAAKTAPMNLVPVVSGAAVSGPAVDGPACSGPTPSQAAWAAAVAKAAWGPGVEGFTAMNAMYGLPEHACRMSLDSSTLAPATEQMALLAAPAAAAAAAAPATACRSAAAAADSDMPAEHVGLHQRRGPTGSLFGRLRKLSWEEEQPEPVRQARFFPAAHAQSGMPAAAAAAGWYPGAWQLPEPSNGLMHGAGGGFAGPRYAQPPQPEAAAKVSADGRMCGYDEYADYMVTDPYTAPVFDSEVNGGGEQQEELGEGDGQQQQQQKQEVQQQRATAQQQQQQQMEETSCTGAASFLVAKAQSSAAHAKEAVVQQACCNSNSSNTAGSQEWDDSCKGSSCKPSISSDSCSGSSCSPSDALLQAPVAGLSWQRPWELLRQCAWGFQDPCLESSYLVFKNHGCSLLDATAGLICTSMLLTSTLRSLKSGSGCSVWLQLMTVLLYAAFFFVPYIVMKLRLQVFLRLREQLLVFGRNTGAIVLAVMALGYLPMVEVWRKVIVHSLSLQIQNGFILPACQQVRLPAALMIAAVHIPADAIWNAAGRPFQMALLHSVLMQISSVSVALLFDAWCRMRFVQRYSGMTAGRQRPPAPHQQS